MATPRIVNTGLCVGGHVDGRRVFHAEGTSRMVAKKDGRSESYVIEQLVFGNSVIRFWRSCKTPLETAMEKVFDSYGPATK